MTDQEINCLIAEACGWKETWYECPDSHGPDCEGEDTGHYTKCPDYVHDLNAMHEAEETLVRQGVDRQRKENYLMILKRIVAGPDAELVVEAGEATAFWKYDSFELCHATARQRAEAFLRTIGKWKD